MTHTVDCERGAGPNKTSFKAGPFTVIRIEFSVSR